MYWLCFSETRTVQVDQFCGQHLWSLVFRRRNTLVRWEGPVENILRGEWCCCEIDASVSVSPSRKWRLVAKRWWHCRLYPTLNHLVVMQECGRTLLVCVIMVIGTHVVGGDGYPRWYESVGSFFSSSCFRITEWRESTMMVYEGCTHTEYVRGHLDLCSCHVFF